MYVRDDLPCLLVQVGFSRTVIYPLPSDVRAFSIRPNLLYLYGLQVGAFFVFSVSLRV